MSAPDETRDAPAGPPTASQSPNGPVTASQHPDGTATHTPSPGGTDPDPAAPAPSVPGYEILEEIGSGGMGVIYRARELAFDRDVAVKLLQARYRPDSPTARRFLDEARITAQLQHPAIPPVHHIGTLADGRPFLVMKLIKGDTLADRLADRTPAADAPGSAQFVPVFAQVCQAVAYAHARKVIHRDLKPANVMVGAFGEVQLMDWGLAKILSGGGSESPVADEPDDGRTEIRSQRDADSATQAGSVLGTPSFMAPEQAGGEVEKVDERADVFGLGAVLCTILTGKPPYVGPNSDSVRLLSIRGETADALARLDACGADPELVALAKRCLAVKPEDRPRDAGAVAGAVAAHLAAAEERARQAELHRVRVEELRKRRRIQLAFAGASILLFAAAAVGAGLTSLWREAERAKEAAESARGDAETARDQLAGEKKLTEAARDDALRLKGIAETAQANESAARKDVEREREKLAVFEYGRTMQLARQEWRDGNVPATLALLDGTREDLRGWEWHYVHRLCHSELLALKGHTSSVMSASFSPDGSRIVTASLDDTARVWDAKTGAELLALKGHTNAVNSASWSPDGSRILTASWDTTARVWDARTGAELLALKGHT
ncbi:MAG TPA: serine/threonine-protein kinase, partial [Gemmataceae bacterium]|nr:serine/threonine-protein kinase [Gemmataceae bacterium]